MMHLTRVQRRQRRIRVRSLRERAAIASALFFLVDDGAHMGAFQRLQNMLGVVEGVDDL
jgi:hypothetical protein